MYPYIAPEPVRQTVLIVDDDSENLVVLADLLQPLYRVRVARSGGHALRAAASEPRPDLILLDVMMPELDGYNVLARLRRDGATASIPVIFVTAMDTGEDETRGLELGAVDYITKPIRPATVLARVRTHLELKQARDWLKNQNISLMAELSRRARESQILQDATIRALAGLAEARDPETGNHLRRTQVYVGVLARTLSRGGQLSELLSVQTAELVTKAAPLHDIGKVGIPDHILLKPGRLSAEERAIMQGHCRIGSDAIGLAMRDALEGEVTGGFTPHGAGTGEAYLPLELLRIAQEIALSHHERWDGTGYPEGLAGENIPVPARLMALADVFDALTSHRVYKPPIPFDEAVQIIQAGRGSHFDPRVVDAFRSHEAEFQRIAARYADSDISVYAKLAAVQGGSATHTSAAAR